MWKDVIELGNMTETIVYGEPIQAMTYREIFANKKSVRQSEFYNAAIVGLKPQLVFEVYSFEFNNDEKVRYNDQKYSIIRAYEKGETTELTVAAQVGSEV